MLTGNKFKKGFTLIELLVIVVIVGILMTFAIPVYIGVKERIQDNGAKAALKLIQAAEESYHIEMRAYVACSNTSDCNEQLGLDLPSCDNADDCKAKKKWLYNVITDGTAPDDTFEATAKEMGTASWHITDTMEEAQTLAAE
ncbi:MAG: prepilin-type N-terminal cleavage/methylation domain-containing protein [Candidatus Omnitrophica bacterium]|nr:prepilin-type N-terminal cleavage/methylation domain-containing protein [Candidatus Omnitrophota bacterium]MDD5429779.1 prepilin-type N-terminal cleavage/methylation domain-containing protein [Candidatus Omnitrophota bacterium]